MIIRNEKTLLGIIFATLAALANATIGLFTNIGMNLMMSPNKIAFYRCLIPLVVTTVCLCFMVTAHAPKRREQLQNYLTLKENCAIFFMNLNTLIINFLYRGSSADLLLLSK